MSELGKGPNGEGPNGDRPEGQADESASPDEPQSGDRARRRLERSTDWNERLRDASEIADPEARARDLSDIAKKAVLDDSRASFEAVRRIEDDQLRHATYEDMAMRAAPSDPDTALAAADAIQNDLTYAQIGRGMTGDHPGKAFEAIDRIADEELWDVAFEDAATSVAQVDRARVLIAIDQIDAPARQDRALAIARDLGLMN